MLIFIMFLLISGTVDADIFIWWCAWNFKQNRQGKGVFQSNTSIYSKGLARDDTMLYFGKSSGAIRYMD